LCVSRAAYSSRVPAEHKGILCDTAQSLASWL